MLRLCWHVGPGCAHLGPILGPCWAYVGLCWLQLLATSGSQPAPKHKLYVCLASKGQAVCSCDTSETAKHQLISCPKASRTEKPQNHTKKVPNVLCDASDKANHHLISWPQKSKKGNRKCLTSFLKSYSKEV